MTMKTEAAGFSKMLVCIYKRNILPPSSWLLVSPAVRVRGY
jgi:hypothetical protein